VSTVLLIARRELYGYLMSPLGYIIMAGMLLLNGNHEGFSSDNGLTYEADGNDFIVSLNEFGAPSASVEEDRFEPGTTVNVRVVPAPGSAAAALGAFLLAGRRRRDARA